MIDEIEVRNVDQSGQNMPVQKWAKKGDILTENEAYAYYWSTLFHTFLLCQWLVCIQKVTPVKQFSEIPCTACVVKE